VKQVDEEQELTRLLAQEPSPLASRLQALRDHGPDAAELASLASRLALHGLQVSVSPPPASRAKPWKKWKWGLGGLGGVSAVLVGLALRGPAPVPQGVLAVRSVPQLPTARLPQAQPTALPRIAANHAEVGSPAILGAPAGAQPEDRAAARAVTTATAPTAPSPSRAATPVDATGRIQDSGLGSAPLIDASPRAAAPLRADSMAGSGTGATGGAAMAPSELEVLRDARLALRPSPAHALELTDEHRRLYPRGTMTQERELIAISALVALGRRAAALSRAESFERQYPGSPYRKQLGDLLR
jgi:hypothetical protein